MSHRTAATAIAAALTPLLLRQSRAQLYDRITQDVPDVSEATYPVLSGLARIGPTTASRLAEQIGLDRSVTSRYATHLAQAGLITRAPDPVDARATVVHLTPAGSAAVAMMRTRLEEMIAEALSTWTPTSADRFARDLSRLVTALTASGNPSASQTTTQ